MIEEEDKQEELFPDILLQAQEQIQPDDPEERLFIEEIVPRNQIHIDVFDDDEISAEHESEEIDLLMSTA